MSGNNVSIAYIIKACYAFLNNFGVIALMILPKLYQCYHNKGDNVNSRLSVTVSQPVTQPGYISGLGNVSHIDRASLCKDKASMNDDRRASSTNSDAPRRPTEPDIPEESDES
jgi:hypothetical protein